MNHIKEGKRFKILNKCLKETWAQKVYQYIKIVMARNLSTGFSFTLRKKLK